MLQESSLRAANSKGANVAKTLGTPKNGSDTAVVVAAQKLPSVLVAAMGASESPRCVGASDMLPIFLIRSIACPPLVIGHLEADVSVQGKDESEDGFGMHPKTSIQELPFSLVRFARDWRIEPQVEVRRSALNCPYRAPRIHRGAAALSS
jgi:hypothetical protein